MGLDTAVLDLDGGDGGAGWIGDEAQHASVGHQGDVGQVQNLPDAVDVGVGFGVDEAGIAVAGVAADALGGEGVGFVALEAKRDGEGVYTELADAGFDFSHARFVFKGGIGIVLGVEGLGGIEAGAKASGDGGCGAEIAVDVEKLLGLGIEGLEIGVGDGPGGGDAAVVPDDAEVLGAHAEHGGAVDFGLAADEVGLLWVEVLAVLIVPGLAGVIAIGKKNRGGGPVELFLREKRAALQDKDALAGLSKAQGEWAAAGSGTDDDRVVGIRHARLDAGSGKLPCNFWRKAGTHVMLGRPAKDAKIVGEHRIWARCLCRFGWDVSGWRGWWGSEVSCRRR